MRCPERFLRGGRLLAIGASPAARSDAQHVAVEFVHPVIVGKRALPAIAFTSAAEAALLAGPDDMVIAFDGECAAGCFDVAIPTPPSEDPFIRQELTETYYHLLWELVHVFFEHGGRQSAGGGAASFLYPFLDDKATGRRRPARGRRALGGDEGATRSTRCASRR